MLWRVAAKRGWMVRHFTATAAAPFSEHVLAMSQTGLLISRHGPLLANAMFLPPGGAVYELLPYNWEWQGLSRLYKNLTRSTGVLHHFAWRPKQPKWAVYHNDADAKFSSWNATECSGKCVNIPLPERDQPKNKCECCLTRAARLFLGVYVCSGLFLPAAHQVMV
jgi:hypothetical protein